MIFWLVMWESYLESLTNSCWKKISLSLGGTQDWTLGPTYAKHITGLTSSVPENYVKEERVCKKIVIVKYCFDTIKSAAKWNFEDVLMIIIQFNYSFIHFFFWNVVSCSPGYSPTCSVAEAALESMILPCLPAKCWEYRDALLHTAQNVVIGKHLIIILE